MKISDQYNLGKSQFELDFIDIDTDYDTPLFLDPYFISRSDFPFAISSQTALHTYFNYLLTLLRENNYELAGELFSYLGESNDVCLGMSTGSPRGHGMGPQDAAKIFENLLFSKAIETGVMEDIEDFRIFVPNVDKDKVSDMTANIIKQMLLSYTKDQCDLHHIPMTQDVATGAFWDSMSYSWKSEYTSRLIVKNRPILLVPKRIISFSDKYTSANYRENFVLNFLKNEHLKLNSPLVNVRADGTRFVTKKSVKDNEPKMDKAYLTTFTMRYPKVFADFKKYAADHIQSVDGDVSPENESSQYDSKLICPYLAEKLNLLHAGSEDASNYHNLMIGILELLLYPNLSSPQKEVEIHEGRKRIDIVFDNSADKGFFHRLPEQSKLACPFIFVECKNYSREVINPELDQIGGRFSYQRGRVGIIVCRHIDNDKLFLKRCADTYNDGRGLILPLTDEDILTALEKFPEESNKALEDILWRKYKEIAFQ